MAIVADAVEKMKYHDDHDDYRTDQPTFNMGTWHYESDCETAGCLATWAIVTEHQGMAIFHTDSSMVTLPDGTITPVEDEATRIFELTPELALELFNPEICRQAKPENLQDVHPLEAAQALRNTIRTGDPQWSAIICYTDLCLHFCEICGLDCRADPATSDQNPNGLELYNSTSNRDIIVCDACCTKNLCPDCSADRRACGCRPISAD